MNTDKEIVTNSNQLKKVEEKVNPNKTSESLQSVSLVGITDKLKKIANSYQRISNLFFFSKACYKPFSKLLMSVFVKTITILLDIYKKLC